MNEVLEKHLTVSKNDQTLLDILSENCPQISKRKLKLAMKYGAVWLTPAKQNTKTTRTQRAKKILQCGDQVHLYYNEAFLFSEVTPAKLISDEGEYSVWNKPCGMLSQGTKWGAHTCITRWIEIFGLTLNRLPERPAFLVHRLDRATNGLIIVAHSKKAARQLSNLFETRKVEKHYSAVVPGRFSVEPFSILDSEVDGKQALTIILSTKFNLQTNQTSVMLKIETGRKHQIRKHLSEIGFAIVGDRLYAGINADQLPDLMLRSCYLNFICPFSNIEKAYRLDGY